MWTVRTYKPIVSQTVDELCSISCSVSASSLLNNTDPIEYAVPQVVNVIQACDSGVIVEEGEAGGLQCCWKTAKPAVKITPVTCCGLCVFILHQVNLGITSCYEMSKPGKQAVSNSGCCSVATMGCDKAFVLPGWASEMRYIRTQTQHFPNAIWCHFLRAYTRNFK